MHFFDVYVTGLWLRAKPATIRPGRSPIVLPPDTARDVKAAIKTADATSNPGEPKSCTQQGTTCKESENTCVSDHGVEQNHAKSKYCGPDKRIDSAKK